MVTRSKKPEADAETPKKASKPKAAAKPKATAAATKKAEKKAVPKKTASKAAPKKAAPGAAARTKTVEAPAKTVAAGRKVGDMLYNDELLEALAEIILLGGNGGVTESSLPEIKRQLFDYDVYMVSFLTDEEVGEIARKISPADKALRPSLLAIRDNAKLFVDIATKYNSVRAFIDRMIEAEGKAAGFEKLKITFSDEYPMKEPACCEQFLLLF
jgi:hypothetical protein